MSRMEYTLVSGAHEAQGRRDTMEDAHVSLDDVHAAHEGISQFKQLAFYGVYDGHGGTDAQATSAQMVEKILHNHIFASEQFVAGDVLGGISWGFGVTDREIVDRSVAEGWMNGSTAVCGVVADGHLYIGNIGDSEAVLVSLDEEGKLRTRNLTTLHKANDPTEKERIESLGGHVYLGRVFGSLAVSRAFGDSRYKIPKTTQDFVTAEPALHQVELTVRDRYIILACDGMWDVMTHDAAAEIVHRYYEEGRNPREVAQLLVQEALRRRTDDNVTVIVVYINWNDDGSSSDSDDEESMAEELEAMNADALSQSQSQANESVQSETNLSEEKQSDEEEKQNNEEKLSDDGTSEQPAPDTDA